MKNIFSAAFRLVLVIGALSFGTCKVTAQYSKYDVSPVNGRFSFTYDEVPDNIAPFIPVISGATFAWQQCDRPFGTFVAATGTANTATYSFQGALDHTMYYRRVTTAGGTSYTSNLVKIEVVSTNWQNISYVRQHVLLVPLASDDWKQIDQMTIGDKLETTTFMDGLGRPLEKLSRGTALPIDDNDAPGDLVTFSQYDELGRQSKQFLPYPSYRESGKYKDIAHVADEQEDYYRRFYEEEKPFNALKYDNSPLNRIKAANNSGTNYAAGPSVTFDCDINSSGDKIRIFRIGTLNTDFPQTDDNMPNGGWYAVSSLYKLTTTDINGKLVVEYKDKNGRIILKKVQLEDEPGDFYSGWICTYSVYDDFGNLRYTITPEAVKFLVENGWDAFTTPEGAEVLRGLCFAYNYDAKGRTVYKKSPGAHALTMAYDKRNRMVYTQDGNQSAKNPEEWTATIYDDLDRPSVSALVYPQAPPGELQASLNSAVGVDYTVNLSQATILKYVYYDNYNFTGAQSFQTDFRNEEAYQAAPLVMPIVKSLRTLSMPTGSKVRVLGSNDFLISTIFYDEDENCVQTIKQNTMQGTDMATYQYHWDGRLLSKHERHVADPGDGLATNNILTRNTYDKVGRMILLEKKIDGQDFKPVGSYAFNELGRLKNKLLGTRVENMEYSYDLHGKLTGINKDYALKSYRGYSSKDHYFGLYIAYDKTEYMGEELFSKSLLTGQINGVVWNTQGSDMRRKYEYMYDNAGRLTAADFTESKENGERWGNSRKDFSVGKDAEGNFVPITYDLNGNLLNMLVYGIKAGTPAAAPELIDNLTYEYKPYSNQLKKITDETNIQGVGQVDFKNGENTGDDYDFDDNGNLITDLNKRIGNNNPGVEYNYLDLPEKVTKYKTANQGGGIRTVIYYTYDADGERIAKKVEDKVTNKTTIYQYINGYYYKQISGAASTTLEFVLHEEGRFRHPRESPDDWVADYFVKDHLQNVRMVLTEEREFFRYMATTVEDAEGHDTASNQQMTAIQYERQYYNIDSSRIVQMPQQLRQQSLLNRNLELYNPHNILGVRVDTSSNQMYKLQPGETGLGITLQVSAGDTLDVLGYSYYQQASENDGGQGLAPETMLGGLTRSLGNESVNHAGQSGPSMFGTTSDAALLNFLQEERPSAPGRLKAYINYIFFDESMQYVSGGYSQVGEPGELKQHFEDLQGIEVPQNGYVYVYASNEQVPPTQGTPPGQQTGTLDEVFLDNIQVNLAVGAVLEENHYYPFGLKIAAISQTRSNTALGHMGYQGSYSEYDEETGWNDFALRSYDPQIGRFIQNDPYNQFASGYVGMGNDPANLIDPSGGFAGMSIGNSILAGAVGGAILGGVTGAIAGKGDPGAFWKGFAIGAVAGAAVGGSGFGGGFAVVSGAAGGGNGAGTGSDMGSSGIASADVMANAMNTTIQVMQSLNYISLVSSNPGGDGIYDALFNALLLGTPDIYNVFWGNDPLSKYSSSIEKLEYTISRVTTDIMIADIASKASTAAGAASGALQVMAIAGSGTGVVGVVGGGAAAVAKVLSVYGTAVMCASVIDVLYTAVKYHIHHNDPKWAGGAKNQKYQTKITEEQHQLLHKKLNDFLKEINEKLVPKKGNGGKKIRAAFGRDFLLEKLAEFYRSPVGQESFKEAADNFFKLHPGL